MTIGLNAEGLSIGDLSLQALAFTMVGDNKLAPYMSGLEIVDFFARYGLNNEYSGFGTGRFEAWERLSSLVGTEHLKAAIESAFDPRRFFDSECSVEAAVEHVNRYLKYDGLILVMEGLRYRLRQLPEDVPSELEPLLDAGIPLTAPEEVTVKVTRAVEQFRRPGSALADRHEAVRNLADVLEYLRPEAKGTLLNKDESDLFELANNFGIRHHKKGQKTEYEPAIWLSWMFYYYLATIHALLRLLERPKPNVEDSE